ncbi:MAG: pentapeptide repeat-containing protein, partial [Thaumarchaeota archaeon]|nr:pentapeptide repeat-containing protein [Nitrososphaerota archaeon]
ILISVITLSISRNLAYADNNSTVSMPWLKDNAELWVEGKISDQQYLAGISLIIKDGLLQSWTTSQNSITVHSSQNVTRQSSISYPKSKNCNDLNFPRVDWSGCDHSNAYLNHANLNNANLQETNLSHANLIKADLNSANLQKANLDYAEMTNIDLPYADLTGASLIGSNAPFV